MIIGITGGIGSGKSTIARELAQRGFMVYDCDREAKRIISEDKDVQKAIIALLGKEAFIGNRYNTPYVSQRVFAEPVLLKQLNAIVHPAVKKDILSFAHTITSSLLFVESAILYETGFDQLCDKVVVVEAPEEVRIARTIARDYHDEDTTENRNKVLARIRHQNSYKGDMLLLNDGFTPIPSLVNNLLRFLQIK